MSSEETISISVMIAGRAYPIRIKPQDEKAIKEIVHDINEKIKQFQMTYKSKDKMDCMAMALLTYAVEFQTTSKSFEEGQMSDKLDHMESLLDDAMSI